MIKIFHHNDMDGIGACQIVHHRARQKGIDEDEIVTTQLSHDEDDMTKLKNVEDGDDVYIVDYAFTVSNIDALIDVARTVGHHGSVVWIDHHDSSVEALAEYKHKINDAAIDYRISKDGSGAYLAFKFCYPNIDVPYWVELVSDYDTWTNKIQNSTYFKLAFDMASNKRIFFESLLLGTNNIQTYIEHGKLIKNYVDADNAIYLEEFGYESALPDGTPVYVVNKNSNSWIFGEKYNEYKAVIIFCFNGREYKYSIFSADPEFNCQRWAEKWGGGGHKGAAGWRSEILMFKATKTSKAEG